LKAAFEASRVEGGIFLKRKCGGGEETMMKYLGSISPMLYEQFKLSLSVGVVVVVGGVSAPIKIFSPSPSSTTW